MRAGLVSIGDKAASALGHWQKAYADILNIGISRDSVSEHTPGLTIGDIAARVSAGLTVMTGFRDAERQLPAAVSSRLPALEASIDVIDRQSIQLSERLRSWEGATHVDQSGYLDLNITHPKRGQKTYDLGSVFAGINKSATTLLDALPYVALAAPDKYISEYAEPAHTARENLAQVQSAVSQAVREPKGEQTEISELNELLISASMLLKEVEALKAPMLAIKGKVGAQAAMAAQNRAQLAGTSHSTGPLRQNIMNYQAQPDPFRKQMDALLERLRQLGAYPKGAERNPKNGKTEIDERAKRADTMIHDATAAGVPNGSAAAKSLHDKRLARARLYVVLSAVALLLSALPVGAQFAPSPWHPHVAVALQGIRALSLGSLPLRGLELVLPAVWACSFFGKDYAELARLSRTCVHKASTILTYSS